LNGKCGYSYFVVLYPSWINWSNEKAVLGNPLKPVK
jgi:hypothetical protein